MIQDKRQHKENQFAFIKPCAFSNELIKKKTSTNEITASIKYVRAHRLCPRVGSTILRKLTNLFQTKA